MKNPEVTTQNESESLTRFKANFPQNDLYFIKTKDDEDAQTLLMRYIEMFRPKTGNVGFLSVHFNTVIPYLSAKDNIEIAKHKKMSPQQQRQINDWRNQHELDPIFLETSGNALTNLQRVAVAFYRHIFSGKQVLIADNFLDQATTAKVREVTNILHDAATHLNLTILVMTSNDSLLETYSENSLKQRPLIDN